MQSQSNKDIDNQNEGLVNLDYDEEYEKYKQSYFRFDQVREREQTLSELLTENAERLIGSRQGQCVVAVREFLEFSKNKIEGVAKYNEPNQNYPQVGAVVILWNNGAGHVAVVLSIDGDEFAYYDSNGNAGYEKAGIGIMSVNNSRIIGYYYNPEVYDLLKGGEN